MYRNLIPGTLLLTALLFASPVHADSASYLEYLRSHGTRVVAWDDPTKVAYGMQVCAMLHQGMTPAQIGSSFSPSDVPGIVDAAQHELCPDTLH
jgi:hypothetical protein